MLIQSPWRSQEPYPHALTIPQRLEQAARRFWEKPAVIEADGTAHTFGRLWEAGRRLGRFLQDQGVQKGERIAILSANTPE